MTTENAIKLLNSIREIIMRDDSWLENTHEPINEAFDMAQKALKQTEWIPVSERLPEELEDVLVCTKRGIVACGYYENDFNNEWCVDSQCYLRLNYVLAWMPMPEPYNGGEQE